MDPKARIGKCFITIYLSNIIISYTGFVQAMAFWKNYGILKRKFYIWKNYEI